LSRIAATLIWFGVYLWLVHDLDLHDEAERYAFGATTLEYLAITTTIALVD